MRVRGIVIVDCAAEFSRRVRERAEHGFSRPMNDLVKLHWIAGHLMIVGPLQDRTGAVLARRHHLADASDTICRRQNAGERRLFAIFCQ